ncbi:hypothetical protein [Daejeonella sp.]|uniref:hypothetical protein n=1 Tax=Daejeonella sp. TaxID=2805397 RepID=UPI0039830E23
MKSLLLIIILFIISNTSSAQDWETVRIDSTVSVNLPKGFTKTEKNDKYSMVAVSPWGTILIFKTPDDEMSTPDIEKDKHLKKYYNDYIKNVRTVSTGSIIKNERDSKLGALNVKDFTLQIDTGSGVLYRDFRLLHASSATYIFEYLYQDLHSEFAVPEKVKFFNSIEVNEQLNMSDQFTSDEINDNNTASKKYLYWAIPGGIALIGLAFFLLRKGET